MKTDVHEKTLDELYYDGSLSFEEYKHLRRVAKCREYGLPEDTYYLSFERIPGGGIVECRDCGHHEEIIGFTHSRDDCEMGYQCPQCLAFVTEHEEFKHSLTNECDFLCPKCGGVVRAKGVDWFKCKETPLFCPKCHGSHLWYHMRYIT